MTWMIHELKKVEGIQHFSKEKIMERIHTKEILEPSLGYLR